MPKNLAVPSLPGSLEWESGEPKPLLTLERFSLPALLLCRIAALANLLVIIQQRLRLSQFI